MFKSAAAISIDDKKYMLVNTIIMKKNPKENRSNDHTYVMLFCGVIREYNMGVTYVPFPLIVYS